MAKFKIVQIKTEEIDQYRNIIVDLWKENLSTGSYERFDWLYKKNPSGAAITWLAKDDKTGEFVGCNSLYPREVSVQGKRLKMGVAIDFAVDSKLRVFGPALQIAKAITQNSREAGFDFLFAWPSPSSVGVFKRAGYTVLGETSTWVKLINIENKIFKYLRIRILAKTINFLFNIFSIITDSFYTVGKPINLHHRITKTCDYRFDLLASQTADKSKLSMVKSSVFWAWRYSKCNFEEYYFFCLEDKIGTLLGFIVYSFKDKSILIWDIISLDGFRKFLLSEFVKHSRAENIETVRLTFMGKSSFEEEVKKHGFLKRVVNRPCVIYAEDGSLTDEREVVLSYNEWFLLDGEMDL